MMKKRLIGILSAAMLVFSVVGCGSKPTANQTKDNISKSNVSEVKTLTYGSACDYSRINPALDEHAEIHKIIFSGLTKHDENSKVIPDLAESWTYDKKNLMYTFKLRKNVKWHDGKDFTADDVKFTIEAIKNPKNNSEIATNYEEIKKVEVVDKNTVKIYLSKPCTPILDYLSVGMIPKHLLDGKDITKNSFNQHPIGTGSYKLDKWEMGQYISLKANKDYYNGRPKIDKVVFKIVEDEKARALQLKSGELDLAQLEPHDMNSFGNDKNIKLYREKTADYRGIMYNFRNPIFKDVDLRKALTYAIDKKKIVDKVLTGMGQVAYSPLQMGNYSNKNVEKYKYNPKKAKELLNKAGWKVGKDGIREKNGKRLSFKITCFEGDPVRTNIANVITQYFKDVNVDAKVEVVPKGSVKWDKLEGFLIGWGSPFDPDDHTYKVFHSQQIESGVNLNAYSNKKVDELLEKARTSEDDNIRKKYYKEFQQEFSNDPPFSLIAYIDAVYGANKNIIGIKDTVLGHHGVGFLWNVEEWDIK
ncbi:ABC transporter substrate-binding protein [Haloimpatiens sp. FM7330]|uniref:ABC transporter substrate-binding protein n=1 Tax=Haloimpatiens sp. FM7330 TaxID=3298610 RepID=UPI00362FA7C8